MSNRHLYALVAIVYTIAIYSTSGMMRTLSTGARKLLGDDINAVITVCLLALLLLWVWLWRTCLRRDQLIPLVLVLGGYGLALWYLKIPEERVHLLQYGVLTFFIDRATPERIIGRQRHLLVVGLATLAGIGDEIIQAIRPNRVGDVRDVFINCFSALLAQMLLVATSRRQAPQQSSIVTPKDT